jgi:Type II CAAX prenyl endopeptidase Rce1-like
VETLNRKDLRFVLLCLLAIAACAAVTGTLFRRAFPEASIEFKVNRSQARALAEDFLRSQGRDVQGARFAGQFDVDDTAKVYLERELGLERAGRLYGREAKVWRWDMRWFRSGVKEEERVTYSPLGELVAFESILKEDAPGARLERDAARAAALAFLASRGHPEPSLVPIEATPQARPNRTDWTFVDEKAGVKLAEATIRYATTVAGDRVTAFRESVHVPEAWTRDYQRLRSKNQAAGQIATAGLVLTFLAMLFVLAEKIRRKDVPWRLVGAFGAVAFVLALLSLANDLPLTLFSYDTASPLSAYLTSKVILGILAAIGTGAGIAFVVAAAEPIYRERFPAQVSLGGAFSWRGLQTKGFFLSVVLGYALAAFFFAYQAVFYVLAERFGAWAPADVPYSDILNTALPWATVLLIGFLPAVSEEGISRMFSISFLDRLGAGRWIAVVLPAFVWGFGHSTYPNQPFYIRGIEVGLAGVLIGFLMLRYGVVPLLVWHFTVDAIYTALLLLRSGNAYYVVSGAIASGILLLPVVVSLALYLRRGGFLPAAGLSNAEKGSVPLPEQEVAPAPQAPAVRPLAPGALAGMGVAALLLLSSVFVPVESSDPLVEDATGRDVAEATARRFLLANGVDPDEWRSVRYTGTGFSDDAEVREERPQDRGGIPGFSSAAARYVIEQGGPEAFHRLADARLPLAWWVVRFYRPEQKEEWKVLIDARRARVAAFVNPVAEDAPAASPPAAAEASRRAMDAARKLGYPAQEYSVLEVGTEKRPRRVDTTVVLEAKPGGVGEARPRLTAVFHGPRLAFFLPTIRVPEGFLREQRKTTASEWVLLGVRVLAGGALVGLVVIVFLRLLRGTGIRWRRESRPLLWAAAIAAAGLANTIPSLFRRYQTEIPMTLFQLTLAVSLSLSFLLLMVVALVGFALLSGARPGWAEAIRRRGRPGEALLRAGIAAAGAAGLARWARVISWRVPSLYEPDPSLPGGLETAFPPIDFLWSAARGTFLLAAVAAAAALALRGRFFQTAAGRALGAVTVLVALLPSRFHSVAEFAAEALPTILAAVWLAAAAAFLLRDHAAAWVIFGLLSLGLRDALDLLGQPAPADRAAGAVAVALLAGAGVALLAGRRRPEIAGPTTPWSGSA